MPDSNTSFSKAEASRCNNAAWDLIERPDLSASECAELVTFAGTARYIWHAIGAEDQKAHADVLFAWALARSGALEISGDLARSALAHFEGTEAAPWELAFAHAACAAAHISNPKAYAKHRAEARRFGDQSNDAYFEAAFRTLNARP